MLNTQQLVGMSKDSAYQRLIESGYKVKVITADGPAGSLLENVDVGRVTLEVKDGKVISARVG